MNAVYRDWRLRVVLAAVLVVVYFVLWNPLRAVTAQHAAAPLIERLSGAEVEPGIHPAVVEVVGDDRRWSAPAGLPFLIGAFVLCLAAPRPRYILGFLAGHLLLGMAAGASLVFWLRGARWGGLVYDLVDIYLVDGWTLAAMVLAVAILRIPLTPDTPPSSADFTHESDDHQHTPA